MSVNQIPGKNLPECDTCVSPLLRSSLATRSVVLEPDNTFESSISKHNTSTPIHAGLTNGPRRSTRIRMALLKKSAPK
ncbi:Hypothetical predicted protein [Cloeon dipterum]|uniref:Uncharacterized protein n=1 Tax=Cloeon dipterum TaxID=197152 RepID=A0A8S1CIX8_9INSE|nr:Hypothetical predicted protein [Cloeon dipterum]